MDTIQYGLYKTLGSLDTIKLKQECLSIYETLKQLPMDKSWVGNDGQPNAPTTLKSLSQYNIFVSNYIHNVLFLFHKNFVLQSHTIHINFL